MAYLNRIATAAPPNDVHEAFVAFAGTLLSGRRDKLLFKRMSDRSQIERRWSCLIPTPEMSGQAVREPRRPGFDQPRLPARGLATAVGPGGPEPRRAEYRPGFPVLAKRLAGAALIDALVIGGGLAGAAGATRIRTAQLPFSHDRAA
jgi:hypothetical protein